MFLFVLERSLVATTTWQHVICSRPKIGDAQETMKVASMDDSNTSSLWGSRDSVTYNLAENHVFSHKIYFPDVVLLNTHGMSVCCCCCCCCCCCWWWWWCCRCWCCCCCWCCWLLLLLLLVLLLLFLVFVVVAVVVVVVVVVIVVVVLLLRSDAKTSGSWSSARHGWLVSGDSMVSMMMRDVYGFRFSFSGCFRLQKNKTLLNRWV